MRQQAVRRFASLEFKHGTLRRQMPNPTRQRADIHAKKVYAGRGLAELMKLREEE